MGKSIRGRRADIRCLMNGFAVNVMSCLLKRSTKAAYVAVRLVRFVFFVTVCIMPGACFACFYFVPRESSHERCTGCTVATKRAKNGHSALSQRGVIPENALGVYGFWVS